MKINSTFINIFRWALGLHGLIHLLEFVSAIFEEAYITASLAFLAGAMEVLASFLLPKEHIHFKGFKTEIHEQCEEE